ncbi:MAG: DUF2177 family protein [Desulfobacterales bacterium]|nr:DUF2177 family protein [Desulfobacterales bacterium]MDJ0915051.1 DUF2177 family protein [Desulfobacterales bacterium]
MNTVDIIKLYLFTVPVFFAIDLFWLGFAAKGFYERELHAFLSDKVNWPAAIVFYLIFIAGILIFAVLPAIEKNSLGRAITMGALFGFFTYATYDLTNLATLKKWPLKLVFVDIIWGIILTGSVATISYFIARRIVL